MSKSIFAVLSSEDLVVSGSDGIDWQATMTAIQSRIEAEVTEHAESDKVIVDALNEVFDSLPMGAKIPRPLAINLAASKLVGGSDITALAEMTSKIDEYLNRSTAFVGVRGRNGGLGRA